MLRVNRGWVLALCVVVAGALWFFQPWADSRRHLFQGEAVAADAGGAHAEVVIQGLDNPWDLAFLDADTVLVTEKAGRVSRVDLRTGARMVLSGAPEVTVHGQGGLHAVVPHPRFAQNGLLYLSYAGKGEGGGYTTHFLRVRLAGDALVEPTLLLRARAATGRGQHFGGAMVFDREGFLYLSVGDRGERDLAQDLSVHNGKILRLHDDGRVPADNPFVNQPGARPEIWSYGHRNPQGLALDAASGRIWEAEHGPQGGDEINLIQRGRNYGWPVITYGREYGTGFKIGKGTTRPDVPPPVHYYVPSIATAGITWYDAERFPQWRHSVFVAALRGHLNRVQLDAEGRFVREERLLGEQGLRMRAVRVSPRGELFVVTDNGVVLRVQPPRGADQPQG